MKIGRQLRILLAVLIGLQALTALAGIGLLDRMSPAIGRILDENVASAEAVEAMLRVLVAPTPSEAQRREFMETLASAESNVTEPEETELLRVIRANAVGARGGARAARARAADALAELGDVNRGAMARADGDARRLGLAGRWALAFLALVGLAGVVLSARRIRTRLLAPLVELSAVVRVIRSGDPHRRCRPMPSGELGYVLASLNQILDAAAVPAPTPRNGSDRMRRALVGLLDRQEEPVVLLDETGGVVAASSSALALMAERGDEILAAARAGDPGPASVDVEGFRLLEL
ncbi:MAG: hypothetical protein RLO52_02180 [Sandaracinaceae bacterium]